MARDKDFRSHFSASERKEENVLQSMFKAEAEYEDMNTQVLFLRGTREKKTTKTAS